MKKSITFQHWIKIAIFSILIGLVAWGQWVRVYPSKLGNSDFMGYWSSAYLLSRGQNSYDIEAMEAVQEDQVHSEFENVIMAWNPPTLFVFLLPLAWLPYPAARTTWFILNFFVIFGSAFLLAQLYLKGQPKAFLAFCLLAGVFPPVLSGIAMGQVTFLVLLGVTACLFFIQRGNWFWAGSTFVFLVVKPHLVVLPVIYILVYSVYFRKWRIFAGILFAFVVFMGILFILRPNWITDLTGLLGMAPTNWATPTVGGLLSYLRITELGRYMIVLFFPLAIYLGFHKRLQPESVLPFLLILTIPFTFFGWSYDHTILLIPLAQLFGWLSVSRKAIPNLLVSGALVVASALNLLQHAVTSNDLFYLWFPLLIGIIYLFAWFLAGREVLISSQVPETRYSDL